MTMTRRLRRRAPPSAMPNDRGSSEDWPRAKRSVRGAGRSSSSSLSSSGARFAARPGTQTWCRRIALVRVEAGSR
jgi:hypothetical protein